MRITEITHLPKYGNKFPPRHVEPMTHAKGDDAVAVEWYKDFGYSPMNAQLRGSTPEFERGTDEEMMQDHGHAMTVDDAITRLDRVIATAPRRKREIKTFRGEANPEITARHCAMEIGESYREPGYTSTSFNPSTAFYSFAQKRRNTTGSSDALSMYRISPNVPAAFVKTPEDETLEDEVVIARGATFTLEDKRTIPVKNRGYPVREITLLVWRVSV